MPNTTASTADTTTPASGAVREEDGPDIAERFPRGGWQFTPEVTAVFPEHVRASVPFYDAIQDLVAEAADWLLPDDGLVVDLGASTGTTVHRIATRHPERTLHAVLIDSEITMLTRAEELLSGASNLSALYDVSDVREPAVKYARADLTLALFTLQFLPVRDRVKALANARAGAAATGALIVAEKVRPPDSRWAEIAGDASHDWKEQHGIPDSAIRAKARALRGVLQPYPEATLLQAVQEAGWCCPEVLFRWHSWCVLGAFATPTGM
ncbi:methyltransferase domain-containing protein [Streptomyces fuscigenes]|uniref:methyltransferase domain-containing protein n=1 Tax=Streptomyces fuscigenes TaxID=1528880 RepID=UPI001F451B57|nr:methyltransferase domain-containing protein [Streptomyces fuscigenes]MCF3960279.1 methyltransferase domain-containing protein [Streptomyces fuscigenes]